MASFLAHPSSRFEEIFTSPMFTFYIGETRKPIVVHSGALEPLSPYFKSLMSGGFQEAHTMSAELPHLTVGDFIRFCQYAYSWDYHAPPCGIDPELKKAPPTKTATAATAQSTPKVTSGGLTTGSVPRQQTASTTPLSLFGASPQPATTTVSGLFGTTPARAASTGTTSSLFGATGQTAAPASTGGLFGSTNAAQTAASNPPVTNGLFGGASPRPTLFGNAHPSPSPNRSSGAGAALGTNPTATKLDPVPLTKPQQLRKAFDDRTILKARIKPYFGFGQPSTKNEGPEEDFTPVFLAHARLHVFAHEKLVTPLQELSLGKLHALLTVFKMFPERIGDIIVLARYAYSNEYESLRELVVTYLACIYDKVGKSQEFRDLLEDGGPLVSDFWNVVNEHLL